MQSRGLDRREELRREVALVLASEANGYVYRTRETASIDLKEEAGRRNGRELEPGSPTNGDAAIKLADEVACMANSPGGGALILGIEDRTGVVLGTQLDVDWLRQRIYRAIDVAPAIEEHIVAGQRVLAIYVAEAREPVTDTHGRLRWHVGDSCRPLDRAEWWLHRERSHEHDPLADTSRCRTQDVTAGAMALIRRDLNADETVTDNDLLSRIGALRADGYLSQAACLLFTPACETYIDVTVIDVPGGSILNRLVPDAAFSLREQLEFVEQSIAPLNTFSTVTGDRFAHSFRRMIPESAVREAILNGLIHRDWNSSERTEVRWMTLDSTLIVRSPGGFTGGVSAANILTTRHARYPALADLFLALDLVEKQGMGIDRMYNEMILLGHRPPMIREDVGPHVICTLIGGDPVLPIEELFRLIRPVPRQGDSRVSIIVNALLHQPFLTARGVADALQTDINDAHAAIRATEECTINASPLIERLGDAWLLSAEARTLAAAAKNPPWEMDVLPYISTEIYRVQKVVEAWCREFEKISTSQLMQLTDNTRSTALKNLTILTEQGVLTKVGSGRSTGYRLASS